MEPEALDDWVQAVEALNEETRGVQAAEKAAQESTFRGRGERARWLAEVREKLREEQATLKAAERHSSSAETNAAGSRLQDARRERDEEDRPGGEATAALTMACSRPGSLTGSAWATILDRGRVVPTSPMTCCARGRETRSGQERAP